MGRVCDPRPVDRRSWTLLLVLASLWGASYLFIEIALEDLSPAMVVFLRTLLAALVLAPLALARGALAGVRALWRPIVLLAAVQVAGPFLLISWGQEEITSSLAGILVASAPIMTALLAVVTAHDERPTPVGAGGIVLGIAGVALLLGVDVGGSSAALLGGLAVVLASLGYAIGSVFVKARFRALQPLGLVTATMMASALLVLPVALATLPGETPGAGPLAAMAALGAGGTGVAFVIFYSLIAGVGPTKASIVAYVAPVFAVIYGVTLRGDPFSAATLAGMGLILAGSWMAGQGRLPGRSRLRPAEAAADRARPAPPQAPEVAA